VKEKRGVYATFGKVTALIQVRVVPSKKKESQGGAWKDFRP